MSIQVSNDTETLVYLDVDLENQINGFSCYAKKNEVVVPSDYKRPIMIGLDTSYGTQNYIIKGNACYGWGTVLASMVDGNLSEEVSDEVKKLIRYVFMMSDKVFEDGKNQGLLVSHSYLQENMYNMLKVVAEGQMISEPLRKITKILSSYGYGYEYGNPKRTVIIKDGPLLSGFFEPFGDAFLSGKYSGRLIDEFRIYQTVALAGLRKIPIIGLTKNPSYSILAQHYNENDVLDYSIVRQIADGSNYFYLGPYERTHCRNPNFKIHYFYLYLEDRFSPLRLEILPNLLPQNIDETKLVEDILMALKSSDEGELSNHGEDYKLPPCIAIADQVTREIIKQKSAELYEALEEVRKKVPGAILDRRR